MLFVLVVVTEERHQVSIIWFPPPFCYLRMMNSYAHKKYSSIYILKPILFYVMFLQLRLSAPGESFKSTPLALTLLLRKLPTGAIL